MRLLSLRPERSASANSATSACLLLAGCILSQTLVLSTRSRELHPFPVSSRILNATGKIRVGNKSNPNIVTRISLSKLFCLVITVLLGDISFYLRSGYIIHQERSCHVRSSRSHLIPIVRPCWFGRFCILIQLGRTQQHGSSGEMRHPPLP